MSKFIMFVQSCRLYKNIKTFNFTTDNFTTFRTPFSGAALNGKKCKIRNIEAATERCST